ncbi:MAG TPA: trehalose-phosphatase [Geminicoccaceae bacterium]
MVLEAVLFDMDGVVTDTASAHAAAWKEAFDAFLAARSAAEGTVLVPFDARRDYLAYVDGRPRLDGVRGFLAARGIDLPEGSAEDPPGHATVAGLGNLKNRAFHDWLRRHRVRAFPGSVALIRTLRSAGIRTALFTSSRNADAVLASAGLQDLFDVRVDGRLMAERKLPGKPDPAIVLEAARRLGVPPERAAVVEDATAGVAAGRRGGFGLVVGVDRGGNRPALLEHRADLVVDDLANLMLDEERQLKIKMLNDLPLVFDHEPELRERLQGRRLAVFLDYDGTLTPIVDDPDRALISEAMRETVARLAEVVPTVIVSGRGVETVRRLTGLDQLIFAGSHGFEIGGPEGFEDTLEKGVEALPELDRAEAELEDALAGIDGHRIERKRFSIEAHFRQVAERDRERLETAVDEVAARHPNLRKGTGKKVLRLQPDIEWDKGHAVLHLLGRLGLDGDDVLPVYVGDDVTDEDAFRALAGRGLGVVVRGETDRETGASYALRDTDEVGRFLDWIGERAGEGGR